MASTITRHVDTPGRGSFRPALFNTSRVLKVRSFDLDITSYATGGEDISSVVNEFQQVLTVIGQGQAASPGAVYQYDPATKKLKAFWSGTASATLNEVTAATDLNLVGVVVLGY